MNDATTEVFAGYSYDEWQAIDEVIASAKSAAKKLINDAVNNPEWNFKEEEFDETRVMQGIIGRLKATRQQEEKK